MVDVSFIKRESSVLTSSSLVCLKYIPTVNLTAGCAHGCLYCYTRGYSVYPGDGMVAVYENTLSKLQVELPRKKRKPQAVYFSPSSDVFQPVPEVSKMAYRVFEYLLSSGVGIAFLTKGVIPRKHMELLKSYPRLVRAQVGLITYDERILKIFEPRAADAKTRLSQIAELGKAGIKVQVRLDPILPGITDDDAILRLLLKKISGAGVNTIAASILFLRPVLSQCLRSKIIDHSLREETFSRFSSARRMCIHAENSRVLALPAPDRQEIFARLKNIADEAGISVKICGCKNPDFASGTCSIAGEWLDAPEKLEQPNLFQNQ